MVSLEWYDYLRLLNCVLLSIALYKLARDGLQQWEIFTDRFKGLWWSMNALIILLILGSLESALQDTPFGARTPLSTIVYIFVLHAAFKKDTLIKSGHTEKSY